MESIKIIDIAKLANVSTGTVDRVLHNRTGVSKKTREKILKIIEELGYKTNIIAKTLASKKQIIFATLIPAEDKYSSYWDKPIIGIKKAEEEFAHYGIKVKNYFYDIYNKDSFRKQAKKILIEEPHAVVIAPIFKNEALDFTHELKKKTIPFNYLDTNLEEQDANSGYIGQDSIQSGKVAAKLIETRTLSTDSILLINLTNNPNNQNHLNERAIGFTEYFKNKGRLENIKKLNITNLNEDFIIRNLNEVFKKTKQLKAIFVTNSKVHIVAKYLHSNKLQKEVILIGYDLIDNNLEYLKNDTIDYLIAQNPIEQGYQSITKLFQSVVLKYELDKTTYLPIDIVIKENYMFF